MGESKLPDIVQRTMSLVDPAGQVDLPVPGHPGKLRGELRLQYEILLDAIEIIAGQRKTAPAGQAQLDREWVKSTACDSPTSFTWCCISWGLNPEAVRFAILSGEITGHIAALKKKLREAYRYKEYTYD